MKDISEVRYVLAMEIIQIRPKMNVSKFLGTSFGFIIPNLKILQLKRI